MVLRTAARENIFAALSAASRLSNSRIGSRSQHDLVPFVTRPSLIPSITDNCAPADVITIFRLTFYS